MSDREDSPAEAAENGDVDREERGKSRSYSRSPKKRSYSRSRSRSRGRRRRSRSRSRGRDRSKRRRTRSRSRSRGKRYSRSRSRSYSYDRRRSYRSRSRSPRRRDYGPPRGGGGFGGRGGGYGRGFGGQRVDNPPPSRCIGVFGLSLYTSERDLKDYFAKFGAIEDVQLVYDHPSGRSRGFGFIYFDNVDDAVEAREAAAGAELDGHKIRVDFSVTKRAHTPTPGIYMGRPGRSGYRRSGSRGRRSRSYSGSPRRDRDYY